MLAALMLLACCSCASTDIAPIRGSQFAPEEDEAKLWMDSTAVEKVLRERDLIYDDALAIAYVNEVATRMLSHLDGGSASVRVEIVRDPFLNAFALPNGAIYVHTGLLAAVENEAQLAMVLGHELTHFLHRHALRERRTESNRRAVARGVLTVLAVAAAGVTGTVNAAQALMDLGASIADSVVTAQVNGFSRDLERDADLLGFAALIDAGYDPREAPKVFEKLKEQEEEAGVEEPFYFGDHPALDERITTCNALLEERGSTAGGEIGEEDFLAGAGKVLLINAGLDVRFRRLERARHALERYAAAFPADPRGPFDLGEIERRFGDEQAALDAYARALAVDDSFAAAHRETGLLLYGRGEAAAACKSLQRYLQLEFQAADRPIIQGYAEEIDGCMAP
jgi:predicted Zn-dependent protease